MASVGDHLRFKDFQTLAGIEGDILNVYYFEVLAISAPTALSLEAEAIGNAWFTAYLADIIPVQSNQCAHVRLEVDNLSLFETDFAIIPAEFPAVGEALSPFLSSAVAWSFQLTRLFRTTRNGSKRIAGVPESQVDNNVAVGGAIPLLNAAATRLGNGWTIDFSDGESSMTLRPVIAKTPVAPATLPTVFNPVSDALYRGVGTQNTRKQLLS